MVAGLEVDAMARAVYRPLCFLAFSVLNCGCFLERIGSEAAAANGAAALDSNSTVAKVTAFILVSFL